MEMVELRRLTPEVRRQQTRDCLLEAAAAVSAARGYQGGSLAEIAEAAGFTTGAIYSNFGSKEDLFLAVVKRRRDTTFDEFFALDTAEGSDARVAAISEVYGRLTPSLPEWA